MLAVRPLHAEHLNRCAAHHSLRQGRNGRRAHGEKFGSGYIGTSRLLLTIVGNEAKSRWNLLHVGEVISEARFSAKSLGHGTGREF